MTIHTAGENGLALFLDAADMALFGNAELNENAAKQLVKTTLREMGLELGPIEISAFYGKGGAMLVALLESERPKSWSFYKLPDHDALLDVWKLSKDCERRYFRVKNEHYIAFPENMEPPNVSEFGKRLYRPQLFMTYLEEHDDKH